ncbi:PstS family phosphate ABC transporter substrate-binding protein [Anaerobacillus isosaccharinicus]|uniref:Phosphate-binding protein n=1 Tax=Anaerobacillus isosaccharinicus TaxID=1532552 RepID=A0A1S2MDL2_9BACI|nr:PstS family phosphate ABC transporter substrate-binding protein [Anaerobacillus isosaccharinicus]MBA5587801.1 PstS family phosphate ABC transporter substrate-binding protein [Anaerobacillus isosaccharinicus]QOY34042.1 PstS family phosphate ABC transporter substrate-binding protein [Anaerobacillus isosaccharinicus]
MKKFKRSMLALTVVAALALATACGSGEEASKGNTQTASNSSQASEQKEEKKEEKLSGTIAIDGSSTVFPILEAVSEEYNQVQPNVKAPVGVSGTGGGFKRFVIGETDFSNASRPIKEEEAALAKENGIEYIELKLAFDGLSVVVSKDNDFVDYLTVEELNRMWVDGSDIVTWKDVRPEWPDIKIEFFSPGHDSGTYDYWNEVVLKKTDIRKDAQLSEDDNVLVMGVAGGKGGVGYFGYAYYYENQDKLKVVAIDNGNGPIVPTEDSINDGTYAPLSRPMYMYVNKESLKRPEVLDYLTFLNEHVGELALEVGYINMPQSDYDKNAEIIKNAK